MGSKVTLSLESSFGRAWTTTSPPWPRFFFGIGLYTSDHFAGCMDRSIGHWLGAEKGVFQELL